MNLKELQAKGGFVSVAPVKKSVTWEREGENGEVEKITFDVYVKRHSFGALEQIWAGDDDRAKSARFLSYSIKLGAGGKEELTYEDAYQLEPSLAAVLVNAVTEVNKTGGNPKN